MGRVPDEGGEEVLQEAGGFFRSRALVAHRLVASHEVIRAHEKGNVRYYGQRCLRRNDQGEPKVQYLRDTISPKGRS